MAARKFTISGGEAVALHESLWQSRGVQKLLAGYVAFAECMPTQYICPIPCAGKRNSRYIARKRYLANYMSYIVNYSQGNPLYI